MISIIGAGPAGSYLAYCLAKQGFDVSLYEEHERIGVPVQCTGIVTKALFDLLPLDKEYLVNKLSQVSVVSPDNSSVNIKLDEYVIDRALFDPCIAKKAVSAGAQVFTSHQFIGIENNSIVFRHKNEKVRKKTEILVGADGPNSHVAKAAGIYGNRSFYVGVQATVEGSFDSNTFTTYFGNVCPGFFGWIVPESNTFARAGIAMTKNAAPHFTKFMKRIGGEKKVCMLGGLIPIYNGSLPCETTVNNIKTFLVGDAAMLCKQTTGGGIITGMISSKILADCIKKEKSYTNELRPIKRELWLHRLIRSTLDKFSDNDYNKLIHLMGNPKVKDILFKYPREFPSKFLAKLMLAEPRFLQFGKHLLFQ